MRLHEVRELIKLMDQSSITNLELEEEGSKLVLTKAVSQVRQISPSALTEQALPQSGLGSAVTPLVSQEKTVVQEQLTQPVQSAQPVQSVAETRTEGVGTRFHEIVSPMVGTFYAAPAPDADPYVRVGDQVKEDTVVCIVEAMKLMNEIEAEVEGEIAEILVENGQLVEYGQPMFMVKVGE